MKELSDTIFKNALSQIACYIGEAKQFGNPDANCCFLATTDANHCPSVRIITILDINDSKLLFLANKNSGKTKHLQENPSVGLCFYWPEIHMQATIEGNVVRLTDILSEKLWGKRDYQAQITAWAIDSMDTNNHNDIEQYKREAKARFQSTKPPLANSWAGYGIEPNRIEFWNTDWRKSKKRRCLTKVNGEWQETERY